MTSKLLIPTSAPLDQVWFERLTELAGITLEIYTVLGPPPGRLNQARRGFFESGENPDLRPTGLDYEALAAHRQRLEGLAGDIATTEPAEIVRQTYALRIAELIANLDLLVAAGRGDTAAFERANVSIYGRPDPHSHPAPTSPRRQRFSPKSRVSMPGHAGSSPASSAALSSPLPAPSSRKPKVIRSFANSYPISAP